MVGGAKVLAGGAGNFLKAMPGTSKAMETLGSLGKNLGEASGILNKASVIGNAASEFSKPFNNLSRQQVISNGFGSATGTN